MKQLSTTIAILALATSSAAFAQGVSFATFDTDGDGVISKEEASANMQLEKLFPKLDSDGMRAFERRVRTDSIESF